MCVLNKSKIRDDDAKFRLTDHRHSRIPAKKKPFMHTNMPLVIGAIILIIKAVVSRLYR